MSLSLSSVALFISYLSHSLVHPCPRLPQLKRMKQLEEETGILRAGLAMVDSARDWYMQQLAQVSDRQAMLGKVSYNVST